MSRAPKVLNARSAVPAEEGEPQRVYIGRPSKWGNPHHIGWCTQCERTHTREAAIAMFRLHFHAGARDLSELKGKDLICWCAPAACHGDVLLELANQ